MKLQPRVLSVCREKRKGPPTRFVAEGQLYAWIILIILSIPLYKKLFQRTEAHKAAATFYWRVIAAAASRVMRVNILPQTTTMFHVAKSDDKPNSWDLC